MKRASQLGGGGNPEAVSLEQRSSECEAEGKLVRRETPEYGVKTQSNETMAR